MARVAFFIDGFNVYHALHDAPVVRPSDDPQRYRRYKWLDHSALARCYRSGD